MEPFRQRINCRIDSYKVSLKVYLGLSASTIHAQRFTHKERAFLFISSNDTLIVFPLCANGPRWREADPATNNDAFNNGEHLTLQ